MKEPTYTGSAVKSSRLTQQDVAAQFGDQPPAPIEARSRPGPKSRSKDEEPQEGAAKTDSLIVLNTKRFGQPDGREYRVGVVTDDDFAMGLRCQGIEESGRLNPIVANRCFGRSRVFFDVSEAIAAADARLPDRITGIKVLQFEDNFPGKPCRLVGQ